MRIRFLLTILVFLSLYISNLQAQHKTASLWQDVRDGSFTPKGTRYIIPEKYRTLSLDFAAMRQLLAKSPMEIIGQNVPDALAIALPMPDGTYHSYRIVESPIMHPELAAKFPEIKTYAGQGITDPTASIRLDVTLEGFHAMVLSASGSIFIDPYALFDTDYYISYYKRDYIARGKTFLELAPIDNRSEADRNLSIGSPNPTGGSAQQLLSTDGKHRNYDLALACTGEYTAFHGGTVAGAASGMVATMNRINGVYERELSVRMTLVANNNNLIYTNSSTDPFTNDDGGSMLSENQSTCNSVIGSANYDIGHVFSTGGGGIAQLGCVCTSSKAQGVTGSGSPTGDPFDIDYVAHEMGHQFSCNHSFNTNDGSCGGNRNSTTAYEIGSGSTIMSYAGICSPSDVQNNSDDYFHAGSLAEALPFVVTGSGNNCPTKTTITHTAPTANAGSNYTIPKSTPFMLTGSATDDDAGLTYCWEEMDLGSAAALSAALSGNAPAFRSYDPVSSPSRTFPKIQTVIANTTDNNEKLPSYARAMNFRLTVRDNHTGSGRLGTDDMTVTIDANSGPFLVTAPNATGVSLPALSSYTVTWDVANTTASPVSCANVDILLSTDGGLTYPITVLANTPNDGTQSVTIPNNVSTTARIRVQCSNNVFFDISNNNFAITAATIPDFSLSLPTATQNVCAPANATFTINTTQIAGLTTPIVFSASGLPAGTSASFAPTSAAPGSSSTLTISNTGAAAQGSYTVTITGTAGTLVHTATAVVNIAAGQVGAVTLSTPLNATTSLSTTPTFTWSATPNASTYEIQVATDIAFTNIVATTNAITGTTHTLATALTGASTYFWRVRGINGCGNGAYSTAFVFATGGNACTTFASTDVPKTISNVGTVTVNSTVAVSGMSNIADVDILNLQGTHTYMGDLRFQLISASGTNIILYNFNTAGCNTQDNFNVNFDDDATAATPPCATTGGTYPSAANALTTLDGESPNGTWTLRIQDLATDDGGSLNSWSLRLCTAGGSSALANGTALALKVFLEGAYSGGTMSTTLKTNNLLPLAQPYNIAPFNYQGGEAALSQTGLPTNMTDWVLVEIWNGTNIVERRAGWLLSNGDVVEPNNTASGLRFFNLQNGQSYSIVVRHRNHLAIMSAAPVTVSSNAMTYDFTTAVEQASGSNQQVGSGGKALMRGGDMNASGVITYTDYNVYRNAAAGYTAGDANLNGTITTNDFDLYRSNAGTIGISLLRY
jgi:subtilisin-like proprotein convertase family protein